MFYTAICDDESVYSAKAKELLDQVLDERIPNHHDALLQAARSQNIE